MDLLHRASLRDTAVFHTFKYVVNIALEIGVRISNRLILHKELITISRYNRGKLICSLCRKNTVFKYKVNWSRNLISSQIVSSGKMQRLNIKLIGLEF
jgi:hypothetical protein